MVVRIRVCSCCLECRVHFFSDNRHWVCGSNTPAKWSHTRLFCNPRFKLR